MKNARYKFNPEKALVAVHWMLIQWNRVDVHTVLKACYFADKQHLNEHLQPVFGATYRAMRYGPVPLEIYEIIIGEALWLSELGIDRMPWEVDGHFLRLIGNEQPDLSSLSDTNFEAIRSGFFRSSNMTFNQRTAATHGRDWQAAEGGIMRYEDMVDDRPNKDEVVDDIVETARFVKL